MWLYVAQHYGSGSVSCLSIGSRAGCDVVCWFALYVVHVVHVVHVVRCGALWCVVVRVVRVVRVLRVGTHVHGVRGAACCVLVSCVWCRRLG